MWGIDPLRPHRPKPPTTATESSSHQPTIGHQGVGLVAPRHSRCPPVSHQQESQRGSLPPTTHSQPNTHPIARRNRTDHPICTISPIPETVRERHILLGSRVRSNEAIPTAACDLRAEVSVRPPASVSWRHKSRQQARQRPFQATSTVGRVPRETLCQRGPDGERSHRPSRGPQTDVRPSGGERGQKIL
jgi:hypothetical protein